MSEAQREVIRAKEEYGMDRFSKKPYTAHAHIQTQTNKRSQLRVAEARAKLTSSMYGAYHCDVQMKKLGIDPPAPLPGMELAPMDKPAYNNQAAEYGGQSFGATGTTARVPEEFVHTISPEEQIRLNTGYAHGPSLTEYPAVSGFVPPGVRRALQASKYQPSWYTTAMPLNMEKQQLEKSLPKHAKVDLQYALARSRGNPDPITGRYPAEFAQSGYKSVMALTTASTLTTHWSHVLRGQKW